MRRILVNFELEVVFVEGNRLLLGAGGLLELFAVVFAEEQLCKLLFTEHKYYSSQWDR